MESQLNRRQFLTTLAAGSVAVMATLPASAQSSTTSTTPESTAPEPAAPTTQEGIALTSVAFATLGYSLPADQVEEVRKQLSGYPADFAKVRQMHLDNGTPPNSHVSPPLIPAK